MKLSLVKSVRILLALSMLVVLVPGVASAGRQTESAAAPLLQQVEPGLANAGPIAVTSWGMPEASDTGDTGLRTPLAGTPEDRVVVPSFGPVKKMEFSAPYEMLFVLDASGSEVRVIDTDNEVLVSTMPAINSFVDVSVTPDGEFAFFTDFSIMAPSWLHRYEVATGIWDRQKPIHPDSFPLYEDEGYKVEAINGGVVVLQTADQHITISLNSYTPTTGLNPFGQPNGNMQLLHSLRTGYNGDLEYDPISGAFYHVESGSSNTDLIRFEVVAGELVQTGSQSALASYNNGPVLLSAGGEVAFVGNRGFFVTQIDGQGQPYDEMTPDFVLPDAAMAVSAQWAFTVTGEAIYLPTMESIGGVGFVPTAASYAKGFGDLFLAHPNGTELLRCRVLGPDLGCPSPWICAGQVVDVLLQYGGQPTDGPDVIWGTNDADVINARGGNDLVCGRGGDDTIVGGAGNDILYGNSGNDRLVGNAGADYLVGGPDNDTLLGGAGNDRLYGVTGADVLRGEDGDDILWGFAGDDQMFGGRGNDYFAAHGGDDLLVGDAGDDRMFGGVGVDDLRGGDGADVLSGGSQNDTLAGGQGDDRLFGSAGDDTLAGGAGADVLNGENGNDALFGGPDTDTCDGGLGTDTPDASCETQVGFP